MKQYHVETKNQTTGEWNLYSRYKSRYLLSYVEKRWHWPLDCRLFTRLVVVNTADAEREAACRAVIEANHVNRKRYIPGSNVVAFIETRVIEVVLDPKLGRSQTLIWQNGDFGKKEGTYGAHTA